MKILLAGAMMAICAVAAAQSRSAAKKTQSTLAEAAPPSEWKVAGTDRDNAGRDIRTLEIDLRSIKADTASVSVKVRVTSNSIGSTGYNCGEGELRHKTVPAPVVELLCHRESSPSPYSEHERDWKVIRFVKTAGGTEMRDFVDLNSVNRINDTIMVTSRSESIALLTFQFDCKGYYKGAGDWRTLDLTDRIATVPKGYVSPERQAGEEVCLVAGRRN